MRQTRKTGTVKPAPSNAMCAESVSLLSTNSVCIRAVVIFVQKNDKSNNKAYFLKILQRNV